jgi:hypothetical protein
MGDESVFVLNDIEKKMAEDLIRNINAGTIPAKGRAAEINVTYECLSGKQEKIIRGVILGCYYKLRYRDSNRIYFSAWDCKDVCSVFYDMVGFIYALTTKDWPIGELSNSFDVDLRTERYVFCATDAAASLAPFADHISGLSHKVFYSSQYIFSAFDESDDCSYNGLIGRFKAEGYAKIQIVQIWIRGDILCYAVVDGAVLRPEQQRTLTPKEEADIARKIYKEMNDKFRPVKAELRA